MTLLSYLLELIIILISVAFFTLLERKILGYSHFRLGPNKVGVWGIFQPFRDAIKLFSKENFKLININYFIFLFSPILGIIIIINLWILIPFWGENLASRVSILFYFCLASISIYFLIGTGWSRASKYSIIGAYRSVAQAISYEVNIFLVIFFICWIINSYSFSMFSNNFLYLIILIQIIIIWLIIILAESNRTPFDFSEGESELVSGFNTEYRGGLFSLIFITEYGSILFFRILTVLMFLSFSIISSLKLIIISSFYIWIRSTLPRLRYDRLILISWKGLLPLVISYIIFIFLLGF